MLNKKTIFVTGANGFVGQALCRILLARGFLVRAGVRSAQKAIDLKKLFHSPALNCVVVGDLNVDPVWLDLLHDVDSVVHLAALAHVTPTKKINERLNYQKINTAATEQLAKAAAIAKINRFIYLSSVLVNGSMTQTNSFQENEIPKPQNIYATSKWEAEQKLHAIANATDLKITILRPPVVYGRGVKANFLSLIKLVKSGIPIPLAKVQNGRSLIYVENLADAIITCLQQAAAENQTYLVSDSEPVSTPNLIREIAAALGKTAHLWPFPLSLMRSIAKLIGKSIIVDRLVESLEIDCSKIKNELGWTPPYTLQEALQRDFGNYKER